MGVVRRALVVLMAGFYSSCLAADLEVGATGGFGFYQDVTINNGASSSAQAGFGPRFVLGGVVGHDLGQHFGLEGRYTFQDGDLALRSQGLEANMDGDAQSILGELLVYGSSKRYRLRFYAAVGTGVKIYQASSPVSGPQPLTNFATLNQGNQATPLITYGVGVKYRLSDHWLVRVDVRDYTTPFPTHVITPAAGASVSGWLHDVVPTLGISRIF